VTSPDAERPTGPVPSCGECVAEETHVKLNYSCLVHGSLAKWAADNADPKVVEKVAHAAQAHERAATAWNEVADSVADFVEGIAKKLRRG